MNFRYHFVCTSHSFLQKWNVDLKKWILFNSFVSQITAMLNEYEKSCLTSFLQTMDDNTLKRIANSVTMGRLISNSRDESISCILLHSESLNMFFLRRKVNSLLLLKYLHSMRVPIPGESTKDTMLEQIYKLWKLPYQPATSNQQNCVSSTSSILCLPTNSSAHGGINAAQCLQIPNQSNTNHSHNSLKEMLDTKKLLKEADQVAIADFVQRFASQFYELLNKPDPTTCYLHSLNSSHFFEKCKIDIVIKGTQEDIQVGDEKCDKALKHLSDLRDTHKILFCPNLSPDAVGHKRSCDGLLCVVVCGTLHHTEGIVGQFRQKFILSTDPYAQYSYKIKDTQLILLSGDAVYAQHNMLSNSERVLAIEGNSNVEIFDVSWCSDNTYFM